MTDPCVHLSDRMPAVAAGSETWTAADARHLAGCADCSAEWTVVRAAVALGAGESFALGRDAVERVIARAAEARLERPRLRRFPRRALMAAAAVALVVWAGWVGWAGRDGSRPQVSAFVVPLPELDSLEADELEAVLDGFSAPLSEGTSLEAPTLGDLDSTQLERVLRTLEG